MDGPCRMPRAVIFPRLFQSLSLFRLVGMGVWNGMEMEGRGYKVLGQVFRFIFFPFPLLLFRDILDGSAFWVVYTL